MGSDRVVDGQELCDVLDQMLSVGDLMPVAMFVFQGLVGPFDDAVGLGCVVPGADVNQFGAGGDELSEGGALVARAVVGDDDDRGDLSGGVVCAVLEQEEVARLDARAKVVGRQLGWDLSFCVAPNPEYVGLVAGSIFISGPSKLSDLAAYDIEMDLDRLESGDLEIIRDEDGDPRMI